MPFARVFIAVLFGVYLVTGIFVPGATFAQEQSANFSLLPLVMNDKGKPRDILKHTITITNETNKKQILYAEVSNFDPAKGAVVMDGPTSADVDKSLANWIEITRGRIVLEPNETVQVPYLVHINLRAHPGVYHSEIAFYEGTNRKDATTKPRSYGTMMVTIEVQDDARERLQLDNFLPDKSIFSGNTASFQYAVQNTGNRTITPRGQIRIYNRKGQEVATLPVNNDGESISPSAGSGLAAVWDAAGRFGKYKAFLDIEYGQTGAVQDTVYFWIFPWREILIGFILLLIVAAAVTYLIHVRLTYNRFAYAKIGQTNHVPDTYEEDDDEQYETPEQRIVSVSKPEKVVVANPIQQQQPTVTLGPSSKPSMHVSHKRETNTSVQIPSKSGRKIPAAHHVVTLQR